MKVKRYFVGLILLLVCSCSSDYGTVKIYNDAIGRKKIAIMKLVHINDNNPRSIYTKTIDHDKSETIKIKFILELKRSDDDLRDVVFFKSNGGVKKYRLKEVRSSNETREVHYQDILNVEHIKFAEYKQVISHLEVTDDLRNLLLTALYMEIQFYAGDKPIRLYLNKKDLKGIRELIQTI